LFTNHRCCLRTIVVVYEPSLLFTNHRCYVHPKKPRPTAVERVSLP